MLAGAVDDAAVVRRFQRLSNLARDRQRLVERHRASRKPRREVLTLHELHRESAHRAGCFQPEDLRDVRVIERCERPGFALEACEPIGITSEEFREHFDRDVAAQVRVAGFVDLSHATCTEWTEDFVWPEATAGRKRHARL